MDNNFSGCGEGPISTPISVVNVLYISASKSLVFLTTTNSNGSPMDCGKFHVTHYITFLLSTGRMNASDTATD